MVFIYNKTLILCMLAASTFLKLFVKLIWFSKISFIELNCLYSVIFSFVFKIFFKIDSCNH